MGLYTSLYLGAPHCRMIESMLWAPFFANVSQFRTSELWNLSLQTKLSVSLLAQRRKFDVFGVAPSGAPSGHAWSRSAPHITVNSSQSHGYGTIALTIFVWWFWIGNSESWWYKCCWRIASNSQILKGHWVGSGNSVEHLLFQHLLRSGELTVWYVNTAVLIGK